MQHFFKKNILIIKIKETEVLIKKTVYLGLSILETSKTVIYEVWYDYVERKNVKKQNYATWIEITS